MTDLKATCERLFELDAQAQQMSEQSIFQSVRQLGMHPEHGKNDVLLLVDGLHEALSVIREYQKREGIAREALDHARIMATEAYLDQDGKSIVAASDFKDIEQFILQALAELGEATND